MSQSHDPMQVVYDACVATGLEPKGDVYKFVCRCPSHKDRDPSLSSSEGADRRALLHCFAGCDTADIVKALGLDWSDLFPDGHHRAGPRQRASRPVDAGNPVAEVLAALCAVGIGYHRTLSPVMFTVDRCPGCDERRPGALWIAAADGDHRPPTTVGAKPGIHDVAGPPGRAILTCFNGCTFEAILSALEHELTAFEREVAA